MPGRGRRRRPSPLHQGDGHGQPGQRGPEDRPADLPGQRGGRPGGQGGEVGHHDQQERLARGAAAQDRLPAEVLPGQDVQEQRRPEPGQRQHRRHPAARRPGDRVGQRGQRPQGGPGEQDGQGDRPRGDRPGVVPAAAQAGQGRVQGQPDQQGEPEPAAAPVVPGQPERDEPQEQHHPHRGEQPAGERVGDELDDQPDQGDPGRAHHQGAPPAEQPGDRGGQEPQPDHQQDEQGQAGQRRPEPVAVDADHRRHHQPQQLQAGQDREGGQDQPGHRPGHTFAGPRGRRGSNGRHRRSVPQRTTFLGLPKMRLWRVPVQDTVRGGCRRMGGRGDGATAS